jgi:choline monooxygenase
MNPQAPKPLPEHVEAEVLRFDRTLPVERASTPPASWYTHPDFHAVELDRVFGRGWRCVTRSGACAEPRSYVAGQLAHRPFVAVRDATGTLRAFDNVCRHHAAAVAEGEGSCEQFVCPYHGWTYGLDGQLTSAPRVGGIEAFERSAVCLPGLDVATWGPLLFLAPAGAQGRDLSEELGSLASLVSSELRFVSRRTYVLDCNWKVYVDNYLDGGYHVPVLHGSLSSQLDLSTYRTELFECGSLQTCTADERAQEDDDGGDFAGRIGSGARYAWVYPNLMLNRYGPILDTNLVMPLAHDRCQVVMDYYFENECADDAGFISRSLAASHRVQIEDEGICAAVQRGLASGSYDQGRYAPRVEAAMHHFHRMLTDDLLS